jgi:hypothetical protein
MEQTQETVEALLNFGLTRDEVDRVFANTEKILDVCSSEDGNKLLLNTTNRKKFIVLERAGYKELDPVTRAVRASRLRIYLSITNIGKDDRNVASVSREKTKCFEIADRVVQKKCH